MSGGSVLLEPGTADFTVAQVFPDETPWEPEGRPQLELHQKPPEGVPGKDWNLWLLEAGRGAGKTEACARYFAGYMRRHPRARGRIIAPTYGDAVEACIEGPSGLLEMDPEVTWLPSAPGGSKVKWPNGSEALVMGTPFPKDVERLRAGGNRDLDWWEEAAANVQLQKAWDQAALGLRRGEHPHAIMSTTPRNTTAYRAVRKMPDTELVHATLFDNPHNPKQWREMMRKKYEGTRLGRQELLGEVLDDIEGALWTRFIIENARLVLDPEDVPDMVRSVVAVDPAASHGPESSDTGIIVAGLGVDGYGYLIKDRTCHMSPENWGLRAVRAFYHYKADIIVGEVNNGGDMVEHVIATTDPNVPFMSVHASRGKQTRAQPIASLFGDGKKRESRIKVLGAFPELEDQLCTWVPDEGDPSPDRLDAMVWAFWYLFLEQEEQEYVMEDWQPERIGADI